MENSCLWFCKIVTKHKKYRNILKLVLAKKKKENVYLCKGHDNAYPDTHLFFFLFKK